MLDNLHLTDITLGTFGGLPNPATLKKIWVQQSEGSTTSARGIFTTMACSALTAAVSSDAVTSWTSYIRAANGAGYAYGGANTGTCQLNHNPTMIWHIKTYSDIADMKLWFLLINTASAFPTDDPGGAVEMFGFRYATSVSGNWYYMTRDGANMNAADSGVAVAINTVYTLKAVVDIVAGTITFTINGAASSAIALNLPAAATELKWEFNVVSTSVAVAKRFLFGAMYVEFDIT
jgi:hypothetical protein